MSQRIEALPRATVRITPDISVFTGETVNLTCEIDQYSDWRYVWYKARTWTVASEGIIYTIRSPSDQDEFWCRGERYGRPSYSQDSDHVTLSVKALPRVTVSVTPDRSVFTGETVTLKCEIEDQYRSLNWRYLWYKDTTEVFNSERYTINRDSLTITGVTESDQDWFRCSAEIHGRPHTSLSSSAVYLTVKALPTARVRVTPDISVFTGETVTLKCEIEDQYRSLNWRYMWYKRGTEVFNSERYTLNKDSLTITEVTESDQDEFSCSAKIHGRPQTSLSSSAVYLTVKGSKPKPELRSDIEGSVLTGNTVTLQCNIDQSTGWKFYWYKNTQNTEKTTTETNSYTVNRVKVSDGGQYWCRAGRGKTDYYTDYSDGLWINVTESPKPVVSVDPDKQLFRGETVTLRCDIQDTGDTEWTYSWTVEKTNNRNIITQCNTQECKINNIQQTDSDKYTCRGKIREQNTEMSDAVTLTVSSDKPQTVLSVSPQQWLTEGDSVTLMCEVINSSTGWTFSWFTVQSLYSDDYELMTVSIRGSKGIYTVSSVTVKHTGVYMCRAERGDPVYHTEYSNTQTLWITGVSPSVSLIIRPNRSQHFSSESLSLSCEDHSNSTGWTVRRYTHKLKPCLSSDWKSTGRTSTCTIRSLDTSDTGVYWCQSKSGEKLHLVNISVHNFVILDSPVHPVTEGDLLTLRCLYRDKKPFNLRAEFYKDGSLVQNQTTGDMMIIPTVSKSHEGFYYCKHPERGESPKSWISVRASSLKKPPSFGLIVGLCLGLSVMFFIFFLVLLWCYKNKKLGCQSSSAVSQQQNISQTSDQKQTEDGYTPLQSGDAHIYNSADATDNKDTSTVTQAGPSDSMYSKVNFKKKKLKSKGRNN
nr:basement membrane-specific heparan sulfate proteoglycan core protein-like [Misgurnus anguillicaudatus]